MHPELSNRLLAGDSATISARPEVLQLDVTQFRRLLAEVEEHRHRSLATCKPCLERMGEALELYRGELLTGFSLPDAQPFEEWQTNRREALHHQALRALDALGDACELSRDYSRAVALAMRQLALDPWNEAVQLFVQAAQRTQSGFVPDRRRLPLSAAWCRGCRWPSSWL